MQGERNEEKCQPTQSGDQHTTQAKKNPINDKKREAKKLHVAYDYDSLDFHQGRPPSQLWPYQEGEMNGNEESLGVSCSFLRFTLVIYGAR